MEDASVRLLLLALLVSMLPFALSRRATRQRPRRLR